MFEDCLSQFPSEQQKVIVQDLILHPGPMKYGPPNSLDVQRVQEWLFNEVLDGESIDHVVVTPYGMEIITRSAISVSLAGKTPPSTRARCSESVIGLASKAIELEDIESRLAALERATEASKQTR